MLPQNYDPERSRTWKADVKLKPPRDVTVLSCKAHHFEQASGGDKARPWPPKEKT